MQARIFKRQGGAKFFLYIAEYRWTKNRAYLLVPKSWDQNHSAYTQFKYRFL